MSEHSAEKEAREIARRVAEYFNGSRDWDDLSYDECVGILMSKSTDGEPPWAASEGGGVVPLRVVPPGGPDA